MSGPKQIFIVRHGEKPGAPTVDAMNDGIHLSAIGHTRATGLALQADRVFGIDTRDVDYVMATAKSKGSIRPIETITPFATAAGLDVRAKFADDEYGELAKRLLTKDKYKNKTIVICWHHGMIPQLIKTLMGDCTVRPIEHGKWDANVFDRVICISYNKGSITTVSLPQKVLFGDAVA